MAQQQETQTPVAPAKTEFSRQSHNQHGHRNQHNSNTANTRVDYKSIFNKIADGNMTADEAYTLVTSKRRVKRTPYFKVTTNGAVACYNIQKRPIVLYASQWEKFSEFVNSGALVDFLNENESTVSRRTYQQKE